MDREAGRLVLQQLDELVRRRAEFAVETTLAGKALAVRIARMRKAGYLFRLIFIWTPNAELSIRRVAARVRSGGHHIPDETIRRRYEAGLRNLFRLYLPLADVWDVYENVQQAGQRLVVSGHLGGDVTIFDPDLWARIREGGEHE